MQLRFLSYCLILLLVACSNGNAPAAPGNVTATAIEEGIRANWEDNSEDELGFAIYRETASEAGFKKLGNVPVDSKTYLDTEVRPGESYRYAVSSRGVNRESARVSQSGSAVKFTAPAPNKPPVANEQSATTAEDTAVSLTLSASDADNDVLSYAIKTQPEHGTLSAINTLTGVVIYTPETDYVGTDSFGFTVSDDEATSVEASVSIEISAVNDAPVAQAQTLSVAEEGTLDITLEASDADGDTLTYAIASQPQNGTLNSLNAANGTLSYTPNTDFEGSDSFSFTANDGALSSRPATIIINVSNSNDAPGISDVPDTETSRSAQTIRFTVNDPDEEALSVTASSSDEAVIANPLSPSCSGTACTLSFTPAGPGTTTMTLTVTDGGGLSDSDTFELTVFDVDKLVTNPATSGVGSLRQIIDGISSGETIGFGTLDTSTITLSTPITVNRGFSLLGPGSARLTVSGDSSTRLFLINGNTSVTLRDITLASGRTGLDGGCVLVSANASLTLAGDTIVQNCRAGANEEGGAIMNYGSLTLTDTVSVNSNKAGDGGGITNRGGTLTLSGNVSLSQNEARDDGGAIYSESGTVTMSGNAKLNNNIASDKGGGVYLIDGSLSMSDNALITLNEADADGVNGGTGGGIYNNGGTLTGATADINVKDNTANGVADQIVTDPNP